MIRVVYLAHPVAGDVAANLISGKQWFRWCYSLALDAVFIAPWIQTIEILCEDDGDPAIRARAMDRNIAVLRRCNELWLCGPTVSRGMQIEANAARESGVQVRDFTGHAPDRTTDTTLAWSLRREWGGR